MNNLKDLLPRIIGFLVIVITIALAPSIYTANLLVVEYGGGSGLTSFLGMDAISPYGGFLTILGLLVAQGLFAIASFRNSGGSWKDMFAMIGAVIAVIILLNLYVAAILPGFGDLIASASAASDSIGETVFGVIPIVIYLGIIIGAVGIQGYKAYSSRKRSKKSSQKRTMVSYA